MIGRCGWGNGKKSSRNYYGLKLDDERVGRAILARSIGPGEDARITYCFRAWLVVSCFRAWLFERSRWKNPNKYPPGLEGPYWKVRKVRSPVKSSRIGRSILEGSEGSPLIPDWRVQKVTRISWFIKASKKFLPDGQEGLCSWGVGTEPNPPNGQVLKVISVCAMKPDREPI